MNFVSARLWHLGRRPSTMPNQTLVVIIYSMGKAILVTLNAILAIDEGLSTCTLCLPVLNKNDKKLSRQVRRVVQIIRDMSIFLGDRSSLDLVIFFYMKRYV